MSVSSLQPCYIKSSLLMYTAINITISKKRGSYINSSLAAKGGGVAACVQIIPGKMEEKTFCGHCLHAG